MARISDEFIEQLRMNNDIVSVISPYVDLRRRGKNLIGLCPFHNEKTPSFTVYPENGSYYCFGCGAAGNVFSFLMEMENIRINRDSRNYANRARNCDEANLKKQLSAGARQAAAITAYSLKHSLGGLPRDLQEIGRLRMLHPELSLEDLGKQLSTPVGKSGANHKMRKLMNIVNQDTGISEGEKE